MPIYTVSTEMVLERLLVLAVKSNYPSRSRCNNFVKQNLDKTFMDNVARLHRALDTGDIELRFHDGRSIKAHKTKLQLACLDGFLHNLIEDVVDNQITGNKRKRTVDSDAASDLPSIKVRGFEPCRRATAVM